MPFAPHINGNDFAKLITMTGKYERDRSSKLPHQPQKSQHPLSRSGSSTLKKLGRC